MRLRWEDEKMNVLIVDDDAAVLETLRDIFEDRGYRVVCCSSGSAAIERVKKEFFDLMLSDIRMPGINGVETFFEVKKISPNTAVIMMTGFSIEDMVKKAMEGGVCAFVYKPFDMDNVLAIVEQIEKKAVVLFVDDHPESVMGLEKVLQNRGQKVLTAVSAEEALAVLKNNHVDIIFLDVVMPGIGGMEALKRIKQLYPAMRVVMITGNSVEQELERAIGEGAYTCLCKPFNIKKVMDLILELQAKKDASA